MNSDLTTSRIVGALFILGFSGVVTVGLVKPILDAPDYLAAVAANANRLMVGALFQLVMAAACAGIGIALYPVLRRYDEGLALGAAGFRIIEAVFQITGVAGLMCLLTLGQEFEAAGSPASSHHRTAGALLLAACLIARGLRPAPTAPMAAPQVEAQP